MFNPSDLLTGKSLDEMKRNFEVQLSEEFASHTCAKDRRRVSKDRRSNPVRQGPTILEENPEKWMALCEQAADEQDPAQLRELVRQIDRLLAEKEQRLRSHPPSSTAPKESAGE
jgi:hypothetical protein